MFTQTVTRALSRLGLNKRGSDPHPRQPAPMLLQKADALFPSSDWTYEPKWDGFRVLAGIRDGHARLVSRNGHSFTNLFGPVSDVLRGFPTSLLLDGEVIAINDQGQPDFEALQARLRPRNGKLKGHHLCYMVFDCLYVNGHALLNRALEERQAVLWELQHALQADAVKLTEGFRVLTSIRDGHVRLVSRNGHSFTNLFGPVSDVLRNFPTNLQAAEPGRTRPLECLAETCCLERRAAARRPVAIQKDPVQLREIPCSLTSVHYLHRGHHCPQTQPQNLQRWQVQTRFPC